MIVVKRGKNPAQVTDEDKETIKQILLRCGAELSRFLDSHPDPRKNYKKMIRYIQSRKNKASAILVLHLESMEENTLYTADELNEKLVEDIGYTIEKQGTIARGKKYLDNSAMSKALTTLEKEGLLLHTTGKEVLKKIRRLQGNKKYQEYKEKHARVGFMSIYEASPEVDHLKKVMSKPIVVRTLHNSLKKYSLFRKYVKILLEDSLYIIKNTEEKEGQENFYELVKGAIFHLRGANPNPQIDKSSWGSFRTFLRSLNEKQLEQVIERVTSSFLENPLGMHYILYRLSRLPKVQ